MSDGEAILPSRATPEEVMAYMADRKVEIEAYLGEQVKEGNHPEVLKAIAYYPMAGGKRLRPVLTMAVAEAVSEGAGRRAMPFGCALELVHNFTLVHDDLMDEDSVRRGRPTQHMVWDTPTAINTGDIIFALGFEVMTRTDADDATVRTLVAEASRTVFEIGEGDQFSRSRIPGILIKILNRPNRNTGNECNIEIKCPECSNQISVNWSR